MTPDASHAAPNQPGWAWIASKCRIKRKVWIHHVVGKYASVSYSRREAKRHAVLVSDLRAMEECYKETS